MEQLNDVYTVYSHFNSGSELCHTWDILKALSVYSQEVQRIYSHSGYTVRLWKNGEQIAVFQN